MKSFSSEQKKTTEIKIHINLRISRQKINIVKEAKYLGLMLDKHFTFKKHMETIKLKLNRSNGLLTKITSF